MDARRFTPGFCAIIAAIVRRVIFFLPCLRLPSEQSFPENTREHLTRETQIEFLKAHTLEELRRRYEQNLPRLGTFHVRAYHYFDKYISQLVHPDTAPEAPRNRTTLWRR